MSVLIRTKIPQTIASVIIAVILLDYFLTLPAGIGNLITSLQQWVIILAGFSLILGVLNLIRLHIPRIQDEKRTMEDRLMSVWLIVAMLITIVVGVGFGTGSTSYIFIIHNVLGRLAIAGWSIMGFYYVAAIFRTLRATSLEGAIVAIAAFLVITRNTPLITGLIPWWEKPGSWVMDVPSVAGMRGMIIGVGVGVLATGIRQLLQIERGAITGETGTAGG
jgi:uncharacterized membrane protein YidH (DUF202 family)